MKLDLASPSGVCKRISRGVRAKPAAQKLAKCCSRSGCGRFCPSGDVVCVCVCAWECSRMTLWTLSVSLSQSWNDCSAQSSVLNITAMTQAWSCLLRAISKKSVMCAGNVTHSNSLWWFEPPWPEWARTFGVDLILRQAARGKFVYINVWLWLKIPGGEGGGFPLDRKWCSQFTTYASWLKLSSPCSKINSAPQPPETTLCFQNGCENNVHLHFSTGEYFLHFSLSALCHLTSCLSPDKPRRLRGYVTILFFF